MADESFYPIIDPNGNVTIIRGEKGERSANGKVKPSRKDAGRKPSAAPAVPGDEKNSKASRQEGPATEKAPPVLAPYDSDEFTDVEALEEAVQKKDGKSRKRFYVIEDQGLGARNVEEDGETATPGNPLSANAMVRESGATALASTRVEFDAVAAKQQWPRLERCQKPKLLKGGATIGNLPKAIVIDEKTYAFPEAPEVLFAFSLEGLGLRQVQVQSFSASDRAPTFALPALALLDHEGCLVRVVSGYPESSYQKTNSRHPMLEGMLDVHADERYLLVLAGQPETGPALPYRVGRFGQLMFSLKK